MENADLVIAALPALAIGGLAIWWLSRRAPAGPAACPQPVIAVSNARTWPAAALPVLDAEKIIAATGTAAALHEVRLISGLTEPTWQAHVVPVIQSVAEMTQQLPASEAHHHAQPGGLFIHTVETLQHASRLRQGRILPPGGDIENQGRVQHIWTVGIYLAALLHDIGKTVSDLRVTFFSEAAPAGSQWQALMGSMIEARAAAYVVDFPRATERDYQAHQKLGIQLLQRLVSSETRIWLSSDPILLEHLLGYLAGDMKGPIAEIVREAEAESVRRNLASGTRVRFAASRSTPLIELLMHALRSMLAEGGRLPLNRPGAAGFCDGTDIWFAAVRLANEVRDWLKRAYPEEPVPGETMNDRLFDTWQEYGACRTNPDTLGAIWAAQIEFTGGQQTIQLNAMLRFPLDLLYASASLHPPALNGRIGAKTVSAMALADPGAVTATPPRVPGPAAAASTNHGEADSDKAPDTGTGADTPPPADTMAAKDAELAQPIAATPSSSDPAPRLPNIQGAAAKAIRKPPATPPSPQTAPAPIIPPAHSADRAPSPAPDYLEEEDCAVPAMVGRSVVTTQPPPEPPRLTGAVVPHVALPKSPPSAGKKTGKKSGSPSDAALRFMGWVQQGLADGSLPYNTIVSLVHFVKVNLRDKEETMMLLVSPAIFRKFAETYGEQATGGDGAEVPVSPGKLGMGIQMAFTYAGWHQPAARSRNVHRFQVIRQGDSGGSLLNGFLVRDPERFVNPVPPPNDRLRYWSQNVAVGPENKPALST